MAVIGDVTLLVLDEPSTGLDPWAQVELLSLRPIIVIVFFNCDLHHEQLFITCMHWCVTCSWSSGKCFAGGNHTLPYATPCCCARTT